MILRTRYRPRSARPLMMFLLSMCILGTGLPLVGGDDHSTPQDRGVTVRGRVLGPNGDPLAEAAVGCRLAGHLFTAVSTQSGPNGEFELEECPVGEVNLTVFHRDYARYVLLLGVRVHGETVERTVATLEQGVRVSGQLSNANGTPVEAGVILADRGPRARGWSPVAWARTGADGRFDLNRIEPGRWRFVAVAPDGQVTDRFEVIDLGVGREIKLQFETGLSVTGKVVVPRSTQPLRVFLFRDRARLTADESATYRRAIWGELFGRGASRVTQTDADGHFEFGGLERGIYRVYVADPVHGVGTAIVEADTKNVAIHLQPVGQVSGVIRTTTGDIAPVEGEVRVVGLKVNPERYLSISRSGPVEAGQFRVDTLPPGTYRVELRLDRASDPQPKTITVKSGEAARVSFALPRGAGIRGRIVDVETGTGVPSVEIGEAVRIGSTWNLRTRFHAVTGTDGSFKLEQVPHKGVLYLYHPDYRVEALPFSFEGRWHDLGVIQLQPGKGETWIPVKATEAKR